MKIIFNFVPFLSVWFNLWMFSASRATFSFLVKFSLSAWRKVNCKRFFVSHGWVFNWIICNVSPGKQSKNIFQWRKMQTMPNIMQFILCDCSHAHERKTNPITIHDIHNLHYYHYYVPHGIPIAMYDYICSFNIHKKPMFKQKLNIQLSFYWATHTHSTFIRTSKCKPISIISVRYSFWTLSNYIQNRLVNFHIFHFIWIFPNNSNPNLYS